jgi:ABC-type Fe3+-hydroxamate transport system substrate-binding protein
MISRIFTDQLNREVSLAFPPRRIISLVPSQTELLFDLGLADEVVGITKFCIHPRAQFKVKTRVGGTKQLHLDRIHKLAPDLIIANKEENQKADIEQLEKDYPVWISDIKSLDDAISMIEQIGALTSREQAAGALSARIKSSFEPLPLNLPMRAAYFIWRQPFMVAAADTFIHEMMKWAGFDNVFADRNRYPEVSLEQLAEAKPQVILLSSEPYPFKEKHLDEFRLACPEAIIKLVDGALFSWYGSRLQLASAYFTKLHQEIMALLQG